MLELNRKAEVSIHAQAADIEFTIARIENGKWSMLIEGISGLMLTKSRQTFYLTDEQASATLALFIGELESDEELNAKLYAIAEIVWKDVPHNFRPIP